LAILISPFGFLAAKDFYGKLIGFPIFDFESIPDEG
jgi:hypothetical protein